MLKEQGHHLSGGGPGPPNIYIWGLGSPLHFVFVINKSYFK